MASVDPFESHRALLFSIAYRMLGSVAEAEDAVQEAFLRWQAADQDTIESPRGYLGTVVTRLCLDQLKSARARREQYPGTWLPEPLPTGESHDPMAAAESVSMAFLVLLESLTPVERAVYLLHEVFDYDHAEVAQIVGKEEAACRQLLHRAKAHVVERRPRFAPSRAQHERLLHGFLQACAVGDIDGLRALLTDDVVLWGDGGGKAPSARKPIFGADHVARFYGNLGKRIPPGFTIEILDVNGWPAVLARLDGKPMFVLNLETDGERICAIRTQLNPDKLAHLT